jgi:hypothetical protein
MGIENKYLMAREEFAKVLEEAQQQGGTEEEVRCRQWTRLSYRVTSEWDGRNGDAFFGSLTPGQFATVVLQRMYGTVKGDDLESFLAYSPGLAMRCPRAFEIVGADEYAVLWSELERAFPGGRFPAHAEGWMSAIRKMKNMQDHLAGIKEKLVSGKGMAHGLWDYIHDYVTGHSEEFCRT